MKQCKRCGQQRPAHLFGRDYDKLSTYRSECKLCRNERERQRYRERKRQRKTEAA